MKAIKPLPLLVSAGLLAGSAISKELGTNQHTTGTKAHSLQGNGLPVTDKNLRHKDAN